ncbi:MAG: hypothetical protein SVU32_07985, partial [Candidatus Nanohaloarchaea archaeon]|nr:hypothetical protein [Candidatus Nanohaloarchaea archaeon]
MGDETSEITVKLFGNKTSFEYSEQWVGYSLLGLRLVLGWIFIYAGYSHITSSSFNKAVEGTLQGAATTAANPFNPLWHWLLNYVGILTSLNAWGLFL